MKMDLQKQLEDLKGIRVDVLKRYQDNQKLVISKITDYLKMHCNPSGLDFEYDAELGRPWLDSKGKYDVRGQIRFFTDLPEEVEKGRKYNFGSNFDLEISELGGIEINNGTIGNYSIKDKYQVARVQMIAAIWKNHDALVDIFMNTIKYDCISSLSSLDSQIRRIQDDIRKEEKNRKRIEALMKLKAGGYLYQERIVDKYDNNWHLIAKEHRFTHFDKIVKITEKTVIVEHEYSFCQNDPTHLKLEQVINNLTLGYLLISDTKPENYIEEITQ